MASLSSIGQRMDKLEMALNPPRDSVCVLFIVRFVDDEAIKGLKNDRGFYCARLPGESLEGLRERASELVREHKPSTAAGGLITLREDC